MHKFVVDLDVVSVEPVQSRYVLLKLTSKDKLPDILPGQFAEIKVDNSPTTFLRRPISVNLVDTESNVLWLLVAMIGEGTRHLGLLKPGDKLNCLLPLGKGFPLPQFANDRPLLVGGGVGIAPLLYMGYLLKQQGFTPSFILGAKSANDLPELDLFSKIGKVYVTTEDASLGEKGFVTNHSVLADPQFDIIYTCGPKPMMKSVAGFSKEHGIACWASLENMMACGLGACLCCVEKTKKGNLCVCKDGPVFNVDMLEW